MVRLNVFAKIKARIEKFLAHNKTSLPYNINSPKSQYPTIVVTANKKAPPLEGGNSTELVACGLSNMIPAQENSMNYSSR